MLLSMLIALPILGAGLLVLCNIKESIAKLIGFIIPLISLILTIVIAIQFDSAISDYQFTEKQSWLPALNSYYALGIDGLSLPLLMLNGFIFLIVMLYIKEKSRGYRAAFLLMQGLLSGVFCATDALLFYIFWESALIPLFLIIGCWGGEDRRRAAYIFFLYTFLGSVFLLIALIYLYNLTHSMAIIDFTKANISLTTQKGLFVAFMLAFAVKIPMWPIHTWLPTAHTQAPTEGSVILAAILLKMGGYGMLRFVLPILPKACLFFSPLMVGLSLIAIIVISLTALAQTDLKRLIAYASVAHMGFVTLGLFLTSDGKLTMLGIEGAYVQMISHGFISGALFLCVGLLIKKTHSRNIADYGGVLQMMPVLGSFLIFFALANAGLPGTSGFVGEFFVIVAAFKYKIGVAVLAATSLFLSAAYSLGMVKRVVFGLPSVFVDLKDIDRSDQMILALFVILILVLGFWPDPLLHILHVPVSRMIV